MRSVDQEKIQGLLLPSLGEAKESAPSRVQDRALAGVRLPNLEIIWRLRSVHGEDCIQGLHVEVERRALLRHEGVLHLCRGRRTVLNTSTS